MSRGKVSFLIEYVLNTFVRKPQKTTENYRKLRILFCVKMLVTERRGKAQKIAHLKLKFNLVYGIIS